ncbi:cuticle protein 10.9-like [Ixodes scapularis]
MFSKVFLCCLIAFAASQVVENNPPQPYSFGYDSTDEFGTRLTRQETGDEFNGKVGSYSYTDAAGVHRSVNYVADGAGFRATVDTNEPGTKTSEPADAPTVSGAVEGPHPVAVKAAAPVAVQAVHAAPEAVHALHAGPVDYAQHAAPLAYAENASPLAYAQLADPLAYAQHTGPVVYAQPHGLPLAYSVRQAPLAYTLAKSA